MLNIVHRPREAVWKTLGSDKRAVSHSKPPRAVSTFGFDFTKSDALPLVVAAASTMPANIMHDRDLE